MCLYPKLIRNPRYTPNKKNGGQLPPVIDPRVLSVPIKCGKCMECKKQKAREWTVRLQEEIKKPNNNAKNITLTFNNNSIQKLCTYIYNKTKIQLTGYELDNQIATTATRLFLERYRKQYKHSLRHWFVTELGHNGTENIHLHGIVWASNEQYLQLEKIWYYGFIHKGIINIKTNKIENWVNHKTINYYTKYVQKIDKIHKYYNQIILASPGIGNNYNPQINKYKQTNTDETYRLQDGRKINLPTYYRNKAYNDNEKELLWINKLNKQERYINGIKIDISNGEDTYFKILNKAQEDNIKLGFGDGKINWTRYDYEQERRQMMQDRRTNNATRFRRQPPA